MELVGQQIGTYRVLSLLGRGGTAEVYRAFHPALKREVAIKVILQEVSSDPDWVRRFRQEAELLGRLDHPRILPVYDAGEHEGRPYLVTKYMPDGTTLRSQLSGEPWTPQRTAIVVAQVADALGAAHRSGIVHRDIKPSNILVTPELRCFVFDFGIAKPVQHGVQTTGAGLIIGTPEYMSPGQCRGDAIDHRSDIYSLGVLTYQLLAGRAPFSAETAVGVLMKHLTEPLPIPAPGVALSPAVNSVLRRAMARRAEDRYASASELREAMEHAVDQPATVTLHAAGVRRTPTPTLKLPGWVRQVHRRRPVRLGAATVVLAALLGAIYALWPSSAPNGAATVAMELPLPSASESRGAPDAATTRPGQSGASETPPELATVGMLRIASDEPGEVYLDGEAIGSAPGMFASVEAGARRITVDAGGGRLAEKTVIVTPGSTHHVRFEFQDRPKHSDGPAQSSAESRPANEIAGPIREWTGYLTDSDCGEIGGKQGAQHLRCAERCIRAGQQPMLYAGSKLYRLDGFRHIRIRRGEPLRFQGWLADDDTIHVIEPD